MRDALSLTDQAIAFGDGSITEADVGAMLGTIDQGQVLKMVRALATANAAQVLTSVSTLAEHSPDYLAVLDDMLSMLHRVAIAQAVPDAVDNAQGDQEQILELASAMTAEDVQLYYQIGLVGKKDLPLAPEPRSGFEMALLRMLAFRPDGAPVSPKKLMVDTPAGSGNESSSNHSLSSNYAGSQESSQEGKDAAEPESDLAGSKSPTVDVQVVEKVAALVEEKPLVEQTPIATPPETFSEKPPEKSPEESVFGDVPETDSFEPPVFNDVPVEKTTTVVSHSAAAIEAAISEPVIPEPVLSEITPPPIDDVPLSAYEPLDHGAPLNVNEVPGDVYFEAAPVTTAALVLPPATNIEESAPRIVHELPPQKQRVPFKELNERQWIQVYRGLPLGGVTGTIGSHCELVDSSEGSIYLRLDSGRSTLYNDTHRQRIEKALVDYFEQPVALAVDIGTISTETPAAWRERKVAERQQAAKDSIYSDGRVQNLIEAFSATVLDDTIQPIGNLIK